MSSPCATPVLVVILICVATQGQALYGTVLLFVYAIGHCLLMRVAGTFVGFVESCGQARGITYLSTWERRVGLLVALGGI